MLPQQKLVVLSIVWSLCIGVIFTLYVWKKKQQVNYLFLLLLLSLLPLLSLLRPGSYESGDLSLNVYKTMALYQSLQDGVFPANWAGILNATYGYPLFNFTYPFPYYTSAFFHFLGFSFIDSLKLFIAATFVVSAITMYYFLKSFLPMFYAFVGGVFYLFAPYHLVDMHFRVDIGEIAAIAFLPLLFLFSGNLLKKYTPSTLVFLAVTICLVILSHQAVSLTIFPFVGIYTLLLFYLTRKKVQDLLPLLFSVILGLALASFYLLPVLFELQFTQQHLFPLITFEPVWKFFYTPWKYGLLFQGNRGELSFLIGYTQWVLIPTGVILLVRNKVKKDLKPLLIFSLCSFFVLFFFTQELSRALWYSIPLIKNLQFSYRLMSGVVFFSAIIAAITCFYLPKKWVYTLIFIAIFSTILNWGNRRNLPSVTDTQLRQNLVFSTYQGEGLVPAAPLWVNPQTPWFQSPPKHHIEVLKGKGEIMQTYRTTTEHSYTVAAQTPVSIQENTVFFPGWRATGNGKPIPLTLSTNPTRQGLIIFSLPRGRYTLKVFYEPTPIRNIGICMSCIAIALCFVLILIGHKKYSYLTKAK